MSGAPDEQDAPSTGRGPQVGSVAEETARLLRALGAHTAERGEDSAREGAARARHTDSEATCDHEGGHVPMGQALTCSLCPVCQGIALLRTLSPQTLDRCAELAALAASTLRDLAVQAQDADPGAASAAPMRSAPEAHERTRRESIVITDEDDDLEGAQ